MKVLFLFLSCLISIISFSQENIINPMSLIDKSKSQQWEVGFYVPDSIPDCRISLLYFSIGELVKINEIKYETVLKTENNQTTIVGYIRNDSEKYYFIQKDSDEEFLLYDFAANVGDTVFIFGEMERLYESKDTRDKNPNLAEHIIISVDTITVGDSQRRRIQLDCGDTWIEGIGSLSGLLYSCDQERIGAVAKLLSYSENEIKIIEYPEPCSDKTEIENFKNNSFTISPNPTKDYISLTLPTTNNTIQIVDAQGKVVLAQQCGQQAAILVVSLKSGIYTVIVNNEHAQRFVKQ